MKAPTASRVRARVTDPVACKQRKKRAGLLRLLKVMRSNAFTRCAQKCNEPTLALLATHYQQPTSLPTLNEQPPSLSVDFDQPAAISFKPVD